MDYFKERRTDVYDNLRQSHAQICLNLIRHYIGKGQQEQIEHTENGFCNINRSGLWKM